MTRRLALTLIAVALLPFGRLTAATSRQTMGEAFEKKKGKAEKKPAPSPVPGEFSPEDRKRLMDEVSAGFYADAMKAKKEGRLSDAQTLLERVLILNPGNAVAKSQLAEIKKKNAAKSSKGPSKDATARLVTKLWTEADADYRAERWDEAQLGYRKILAIEPTSKKAKTKLEASEARLLDRLKQRGDDREKSGDLEGALEAYQAALRHGGDASIAERAARLQKRLVETNRRKSDEVYAAALSASQQGNNEKARGLCRQALRMDPSNIQAQRMLERLERRTR
jgi:tetratricopeptide (TPR) repeat protein